jgi:hypothetical protein
MTQLEKGAKTYNAMTFFISNIKKLKVEYFRKLVYRRHQLEDFIQACCMQPDDPTRIMV